MSAAGLTCELIETLTHLDIDFSFDAVHGQEMEERLVAPWIGLKTTTKVLFDFGDGQTL